MRWLIRDGHNLRSRVPPDIATMVDWAYNITGFQARSRGGRWSWTLKLAQKRSWAGRWSWTAKVRLLSLRVVPQQQSNGHCPCDSAQTRQLTQSDSAQTRQLTQQLRSDLVRYAMARGHLNTSIFSGGGPRSLRSFSGGIRGRAFTLSSSSPPVPVPNKLPCFCGRKAVWSWALLLQPLSNRLTALLLHVILMMV